MKLSTKTQYSLRILLQIAMASREDQLVQGREIAARQGINEPYLEQIMINLKNAGLVSTVRGRKGGYLLARDPEEITLLELIEVFEGTIEFVEAEAPSAPETRAANAAWKSLGSRIRGSATNTTLAEVLRDCLGQSPEYMI